MDATLDEDADVPVVSGGRIVRQVAGNGALLLLISGAILAAAVLFGVGAFTAGSAGGVLVSSFIAGFVTIMVFALGVKRYGSAIKRLWHKITRPETRLFGSTDVATRSAKAVAEGTVWQFAFAGLAYASFVMFVAGVIRLFI